jgi:hypothetical protein
VTVENFVRAETDKYFDLFVTHQDALGRFNHSRDLPLEEPGVRPNRDTLYSLAVFDLDAGSVTISLPNAGDRFRSMMVMDEDHYVTQVVYDPGDYTYDKEQIGTRYLFVAVRTLVDPADPHDIEQAHALQDAITVQQASRGRFEVPSWDTASHKTIRDALLVLSASLPDLRRAFGSRDQVDPVRHLIATASAWGGNPDDAAVYLNVTPSKNDGSTIYRLDIGEVPVDAFWSISVYNQNGRFRKNADGAYTLNNLTARKNADGSVTVQFGGCDGQITNCLPIFPDWNYMVRLYRPRKEILDGAFTFPMAQPAT